MQGEQEKIPDWGKCPGKVFFLQFNAADGVIFGFLVFFDNLHEHLVWNMHLAKTLLQSSLLASFLILA